MATIPYAVECMVGIKKNVQKTRREIENIPLPLAHTVCAQTVNRFVGKVEKYMNVCVRVETKLQSRMIHKKKEEIPTQRLVGKKKPQNNR